MKKQIKTAVRRFAQHFLGDEVPPPPPQSTWAAYSSDALQIANFMDCSPEQMQQQQQHPERISANVKDRVCNWYLPPFDNPFYGGIMTILRLVEFMQRSHGIRQRILICGVVNGDEVRANIVGAFPALSQIEVFVLDTEEAKLKIPPADYSFATFWTTAYVLLGVQNTGCKFYMIQDFEPAFYPAGSTYAQAELSYRFGFYGIANTQSLKEIYERDYGGSAVVLKPTIDKSVFYPNSESIPSTPKRLFYYARPGTPRNGFELAAAALQQLKYKYGDAVDIICAGSSWSPAEYGLENAVRTIGMLPYKETANLYRSCHAGFVMMMTKHPSYLPFELMACGAIVVTNYNQANTWLLKDGENCLLSAPSASCLADTLSYALDHYDELAPLRQRAINDIYDNAGDWDDSLSEVVSFILKPPSVNQPKETICNSFFATRQS